MWIFLFIWPTAELTSCSVEILRCPVETVGSSRSLRAIFRCGLWWFFTHWSQALWKSPVTGRPLKRSFVLSWRLLRTHFIYWDVILILLGNLPQEGARNCTRHLNDTATFRWYERGKEKNNFGCHVKDCFRKYDDLVIICHFILLGVWKVSLLKIVLLKACIH